MSATDLQPNHAPISPPAPTTPSSPSINPKRSMFGIKKKSTQNLGSSPSSNTLASATSSLKSGESVESLDKSGGGGPNGGKKRMGVFGKRSKTESGGAGFTNTEEDKDNGGSKGGGRGNKERASEDHSSRVVYESDEDMAPQSTTYPPGFLTLSPTSPTLSNGQTSSAPGKKPVHAATFSPSNTAVSFGSTKPDAGSGKRGVGGILGVPFIRRSTSPRPDGIRVQNTTTGGTLSPVSSGSPGIPETQAIAEARPATSGGERKSEDQSRRAGRSSVGTSDGSDIPTVLPLKVTVGPRNPKLWPSISTKDSIQSTSIPQSSVSADGSPVMTTVTPPTPTELQPQFPLKSPVGVVQAGNTKMNKGSRTNSLGSAPSKLSHSMTAPLTPPTGGGSSDGTQQTGQGNTGGGFFLFQSMFSAAQSAAATLGNSIANTNIANAAGSRSRSSTGASEGGKGDAEKENMQQNIAEPEREKIEPQKRPAVETLGQGELSLGSLGILPGSQAPNAAASESKPSRSASVNSRGTNSETGDLRAVADGGILAQAGGSTARVGRAGTIDGGLSDDALRSLGAAMSPRGGVEIGENTLNDSVSALVGLEGSRKTPLAEDSAFISKEGDYTPEKGVLGAPDDRDDAWFGGDADRRSGSIMSGNRRKRGSSAASGGNLQPVPKLTGFAVAPKRRNREFHEMFMSVPEDDYLIEDYGCALQKEILLQGRLYVSEGHICFNSNIFGWINTLVISFDEIVSVEKKNTAMVFPNAIVIQTLHARNVFASLISRDSTYDLIVGIWKIGHPQLVAGATGVRLRDGGDADEGDQVDGVSEYEEDGEDEDEYEDESDDGESYTDASDGVLSERRARNEGGVSNSLSRKASQAVMALTGGGGNGGVVDYPGPLTHAPTSCDDIHYDKLLCSDVVLAPLGKVYSLIFGPGSYPFMSKFLADEEKVLEISIPDKGEWVDGPDGKKTRSFSYIKPLNNGIGPKQTKCNITETLDICDLEDHVSVTVATQTPDVPSGSVFMVKTRYCLSWAEDGATRFVSSCTIEWSGKSWLKVPIEKAAGDGQVAYSRSLLTALKREVEPKEPMARRNGNKSKKRKKGGDVRGEVAVRSGGAIKGRDTQAPGFESPADQSSWGIFAPLKVYLGPIADIIGPLIAGNIGVVVIFFVLIFFFYLQTRGTGGTRCDIRRPRVTLGGRHWEEVWRNEEEGLRDWLEARIGLGNIEDGGCAGDSGARSGLIEERKEGDVEDALAVIEELVKVLRRTVEDRKQARGKS